MSRYVVDASVAAKWFFPEPYGEAAMGLYGSGHELYAPALFRLELTSIICKRVRRGELTPAEAEEVRGALERLPLRFHDDRLLLPLAFEVATTTGCSLYDAIYLALAEVVEGRMITADRRFFDRRRLGVWAGRLLWIETLLPGGRH